MTDAIDELARKIASPTLDLQTIGALLDGLTETDRVAAALSVRGAAQKRLWDAAAGKGARVLRLTDIVPAITPAMTGVVHHGRNSMPAFTLFEKRFYRMPEGAAGAPGMVCGANFQTFAWFTGPGYFVATEDQERGEVLIDYHRVPETAPSGWPAIRPNDRGITRLVYGFMTDALRRVSEHVTIGMPSRHGRSLGSYFVLCRQG
jgi:hypothetical protein